MVRPARWPHHILGRLALDPIMQVELVQTLTADELRLDGALHAAPVSSTANCRVDVLLSLHGVGGNFYGSSLFHRVTPKLLAAGIPVLWANTRGHDSVFTGRLTSGVQRLGAAYEVVDDCRHDIDGWLGFLQERGFRSVGLWGHSLGAIKSIYCAASQADVRIATIIASSAPRLSYSVFREGPDHGRFTESYAQAKRLIAAGTPGTLFEASFPYPLLISAGTFVDKYGPNERYNIVQLVDHVPVPLLLTYGSLELEQGSSAFAGLVGSLSQIPDPHQHRHVSVIPEGDHNYTGVHDALADVLLTWLGC
ncbi:MAG: hypothetical protein KDA60_04865 [Planctomycetales bacterium]|nr:hypothetical protein [Planctomycetales bacterium]